MKTLLHSRCEICGDWDARRFEVSVDDPETDVLEHIAKKVTPSLEQRAKIIARNRKERG